MEIVSTYDPDEHELVQLSAYLHVSSDSEDDDEAENDQEKENDSSLNRLIPYSNSDDSTDDACPTDTNLSHQGGKLIKFIRLSRFSSEDHITRPSHYTRPL